LLFFSLNNYHKNKELGNPIGFFFFFVPILSAYWIAGGVVLLALWGVGDHHSFARAACLIRSKWGRAMVHGLWAWAWTVSTNLFGEKLFLFFYPLAFLSRHIVDISLVYSLAK